jgi:uncharacterized protein YndB with AHSA1/START domain
MSTPQHELVITRDVPVPAAKLYQGWTDPELMKKWFVPKPWSIASVKIDLRTGGSSEVVMRSPEGQEFPNRGIYLEVVPNKKLVFTDAYTEAWVPSEHPFMTVIVTFEELGNGLTRYTARALHWTEEDRKKHEEMGFEPGWNTCLDQLVELMSGQ